MLSFFFIPLPDAENCCHLFLFVSSSLFAFTLRGILAGFGGPSLTLLGSFFAWLARAGLMSAAADMTPEVAGAVGVVGVTGEPSALRFFESFEIGLIS